MTARSTDMILPLIAAVAMAAMPAQAPLSAYRGRARMLLLFAPGARDPRLAAQERALAGAAGGMAERDLHVARIVGDRVEGVTDGAAALRRRFGVSGTGFAMRLVGKDGHVAIAREAPIAADALFATIDAMPMRRDEMRERTAPARGAVPPPRPAR